MTLKRLRWLALALICAFFAPPAFGQFGRQRARPRLAAAGDFDGSWHLCRLAYQGRG